MTFILGGLAVVCLTAFFKLRKHGEYIPKSALQRHLIRIDDEATRTELDRRVYELAKGLTDHLATDRSCRHEGDWWLGDRCRTCAIVAIKETLYIAVDL
jgi:hypothetical protein